MSFSALKRSRGSIEQLTKAIQSASESRKDDERFWQPTVDNAGNGHAAIRFLPAPPQDGEEGLPWVRTFSHGFKGPGGWLIDLCPTTLQGKCPVCEANSKLWETGIKANKDIASSRKRKLYYTANIYIVTDPANPENNGKVRLYRFGKKIFDKIYAKMHPEEGFGEKAYIPFDLWEGATFRLRARKVSGQRNYDDSDFAAPSPISTDEAKIEEIWKSEYGLKEFLNPENFKSYEQIKSRFALVVGSAAAVSTADQAGSQGFSDADVGMTPPAKSAAATVLLPGEDDADADYDHFKSLVDS
jgi:hypothetical protein